MQVVRLFLPFTALSTVIGFVHMTRSVAENGPIFEQWSKPRFELGSNHVETWSW